jgi:hypothetical protein
MPGAQRGANRQRHESMLGQGQKIKGAQDHTGVLIKKFNGHENLASKQSGFNCVGTGFNLPVRPESGSSSSIFF